MPLNDYLFEFNIEMNENAVIPENHHIKNKILLNCNEALINTIEKVQSIKLKNKTVLFLLKKIKTNEL